MTGKGGSQQTDDHRSAATAKCVVEKARVPTYATVDLTLPIEQVPEILEHRQPNETGFGEHVQIAIVCIARGSHKLFLFPTNSRSGVPFAVYRQIRRTRYSGKLQVGVVKSTETDLRKRTR